MELSIFLAQLFGVYFIVVGAFILYRRKELPAIVSKFVTAPEVSLYGVFVFVLGLILVLVHNLWFRDWVVVITVVAWLTVAKGLFYMFASSKRIKKVLAHFTKGENVYIYSGVLILLIGIYLTLNGFSIA